MTRYRGYFPVYVASLYNGAASSHGVSLTVSMRSCLIFFGLLLSFVPSAHAQSISTQEEFTAAIDALLNSASHPYLARRDFRRDSDAVRRFYAARQSAPAWHQGEELTRAAIELLHTLRAAYDFGLNADDYDGTTLTYFAIDSIGADTTARAHLDLAITIATARFLRHLHFGRVDPRAAGFDLNSPRAPFDLAAMIERIASTTDTAAAIEAVEPTFLHYQLLKKAMKRYRLLAVDSDLTQLPPFKARSVKPGEAYDGIPQLRLLLIALGDLPEDAATSDGVLDERLSQALTRFQQRHGLAADGALGRKTYAALTTPLTQRAQQLAHTMERWRWLPEFATPPIIVNIPQFKLFAFRSTADRAADILQMDVIVGKTFPTAQTPAFTAELKYVVFRPYWDVPESILRDEMLPEMATQSDSLNEYLDKHNLEIVSSGDPSGAPLAPTADSYEQLAAGALRLRQRPGDDNSLGLVKLMLPNSYNVYLHSTPAKRLFAEPRRAFSHGCIRVADPAGLVEHVLRGESGDWMRDKIEAAMQDDTTTGNNRHVFLSKPIPVLIVYGTAMALENGDVQFFEDIYGHDDKLAKLLR